MNKWINTIKATLEPLFYSRLEKRHNLVGPAKLWKLKRDIQIDYLKNVGLQPQHLLFDLGCGTLRGGIPIIDYLEDGHYYGFDTRELVITEAAKELEENHLENKRPVLLCKPGITQLSLDVKFDYIWAFAVLFHLEDSIAKDCIQFAAQHLNASGGAFYANANIGDQPDGVWRDFGFPLVWRSFDFYDQIAKSYGLKLSDLGAMKDLTYVTHTTQDDQRMLKFTA